MSTKYKRLDASIKENLIILWNKEDWTTKPPPKQRKEELAKKFKITYNQIHHFLNNTRTKVKNLGIKLLKLENGGIVEGDLSFKPTRLKKPIVDDNTSESSDEYRESTSEEDTSPKKRRKIVNNDESEDEETSEEEQPKKNTNKKSILEKVINQGSESEEGEDEDFQFEKILEKKISREDGLCYLCLSTDGTKQWIKKSILINSNPLMKDCILEFEKQLEEEMNQKPQVKKEPKQNESKTTKKSSHTKRSLLQDLNQKKIKRTEKSKKEGIEEILPSIEEKKNYKIPKKMVKEEEKETSVVKAKFVLETSEEIEKKKMEEKELQIMREKVRKERAEKEKEEKLRQQRELQEKINRDIASKAKDVSSLTSQIVVKEEVEKMKEKLKKNKEEEKKGIKVIEVNKKRLGFSDPLTKIYTYNVEIDVEVTDVSSKVDSSETQLNDEKVESITEDVKVNGIHDEEIKDREMNQEKKIHNKDRERDERKEIDYEKTRREDRDERQKARSKRDERKERERRDERKERYDRDDRKERDERRREGDDRRRDEKRSERDERREKEGDERENRHQKQRNFRKTQSHEEPKDKVIDTQEPIIEEIVDDNEVDLDLDANILTLQPIDPTPELVWDGKLYHSPQNSKREFLGSYQLIEIEPKINSVLINYLKDKPELDISLTLDLSQIDSLSTKKTSEYFMKVLPHYKNDGKDISKTIKTLNENKKAFVCKIENISFQFITIENVQYVKKLSFLDVKMLPEITTFIVIMRVNEDKILKENFLALEQEYLELQKSLAE